MKKEITPEEEKRIFERVKSLTEKFKGTHNFHNYTVKMKAKDKKAQRYIIDINCQMLNDDKYGKFIRFDLHG
jgi:tRNA pseudouridine38-40 synthase